MFFETKQLLLTAAACGLLLTGSAQAVVIYSDNFDGPAATDINGLAPDVGANNWVAHGTWNADGTIDHTTGTVAPAVNGSSMTLAFTPANGLIYTLDASITGIAGDTDWFGVGFANGQSTVNSANTRFITNTVVGTAWMLFRGQNLPAPTPPETTPAATFNVAQLGTGAKAPTNNGGLTSPANWSALDTTAAGDIDMRIVLDTTDGTGLWTATWYAKRPGDASYSEVRATTLVPQTSEANFTSVGLAISNPSTTNGISSGVIQSFSLSSATPFDPADLDQDGDVDDADYGIAFAAFTGPGGSSTSPADLDNDGDVDDADYGIAFAAFTGPLSPASVPEPTSLALLGLGGLMVARRRRA